MSFSEQHAAANSLTSAQAAVAAAAGLRLVLLPLLGVRQQTADVQGKLIKIVIKHRNQQPRVTSSVEMTVCRRAARKWFSCRSAVYACLILTRCALSRVELLTGTGMSCNTAGFQSSPSEVGTQRCHFCKLAFQQSADQAKTSASGVTGHHQSQVAATTWCSIPSQH
jgi:hypothetical protein